MINLQVRSIAAHNAEVYILRVEVENLLLIGSCFYTERSEQKIWFQKYFTENVLNPLLKQAYHLRVLYSKVRSLNVIHTFFLILVRSKCLP